MDDHGRRRSALRELTLVVATLGLVTGAAGGALRGLDALAGYLQGEPRGVKRYGSIEEVEGKLGARLSLPSYFPDTLQWPPAAVRIAGGARPAVALTFHGREGSGQRLILYQTLGSPAPIPRRLHPPGELLHARGVRLDGLEGRLSRILGEDGEIWHEVTWESRGRGMALRFKGPVDELLRIARSMARRSP